MSIPGIWNGLSPEQWSAKSEEAWDEFVEGTTTVVLPDGYYKIETEHGIFIQVQMAAIMSEPPDVFVRTSHYGPAMKVLIPEMAQPGDRIRIRRRSKSGKSLIGVIV